MGLPRLRFGNDGDFFGGLVKKDIERLNALKTAYDEQKYRVVKLLEYDSKRIGIRDLQRKWEWNGLIYTEYLKVVMCRMKRYRSYI